MSLPRMKPLPNAEELAAVIDQSGLWYPLVSPTEQPLSSQALGIFWADFSQLTNAIGDVRNFEAETQYGVSVWRLRLTRTTDETVFSYPSAETNLFQLAVTAGDFSNHYDRVLWSWAIIHAPASSSESYDDLLGGRLHVPQSQTARARHLARRTSTTARPMTTMSAAVNSAALGLSTGGFMMMDDEIRPAMRRRSLLDYQPDAAVLCHQHYQRHKRHNHRLAILPHVSLHRALGQCPQHEYRVGGSRLYLICLGPTGRVGDFLD